MQVALQNKQANVKTFAFLNNFIPVYYAPFMLARASV